MTLQARAPSTEPAQSLYVSFLERFRPSARRLPGTAALKRAGTATLGRVLTAGGNALKRAKRFSGKERRQKALIVSHRSPACWTTVYACDEDFMRVWGVDLTFGD